MEIKYEMLDFWKLPHTLQEKVIARYMEYIKKPKPFVIQSHIRGKSQHLDWRMQVDNYLIGWSIVGGRVEDPITPDTLLERIGKGFRAETKCYSEICNEWKFDIHEVNGQFYFTQAEIPHVLNIEELARQPLIWLKVHGKIKPGEIGAGIEAPGEFIILTKGKWMSGAQKPWFHEYFLKDNKFFKKWTRIVVRAVRAPRIDPVTKKPIKGQYERFWRVMIPKTQMPYAISKRAREEDWIPPKNIVPFPEDWVKKEWPEEYKQWKEWLEEKKEKHELSKNIKFTLSLHKFRGPIHIRGMWKLDWYLFLDDKGKGQIRTFNLKGDPLRETLIEAWYEGRDSRKYLEWEGRTKPMSRFNPNKDLYGEMSILDTGIVEYDSIIEKGEEKITLNFKGKLLKGKWILEQEDPASEAYAFYKAKVSIKSLASYKFVYHKHYWNDKVHFDLRWKTSETRKEEFNLTENILEKGIEEEIKAIFKEIRESREEVEYWMVDTGRKIKRKIGKLETFVDVLDSGTLNIIERNPQFISMLLKGKKLNGIIVARKQNGYWLVSKAKLPRALSIEGNPRTGKYYEPFVIEQKRNWDYFIVYLYDLREFTRCEPKEKSEKYEILPGKIPEGVDIAVCLYPRPGKIHGARIAYIKFNLKNWTAEKAVKWIKEKKLHLWSGIQVRATKEELAAELYPWIEIKSMDIPDRSLTGLVFTETGARKIKLRAWTDTLALKIMELYLKGHSMFRFRVYGGYITQIINYKTR